MCTTQRDTLRKSQLSPDEQTGSAYGLVHRQIGAYLLDPLSAYVRVASHYRRLVPVLIGLNSTPAEHSPSRCTTRKALIKSTYSGSTRTDLAADSAFCW